MKYIFKFHLLLSCLLIICAGSFAQTEFPKEFIAHVKLQSGMITAKGNAPDLFVGGLQVVPQFTLVPGKLRGGVVAGGAYSYKRISGLFGPTISLKVLEFKGGNFGTLGNLHVNADHLWGTSNQRLLGGGINLDLLNKLIVGLSAHRDYNFKNWWIQSGIGFRISKVKKPVETFPN